MTNPDTYCPSCGAAPGYDCVARGKVVLPHKARTESAESLKRAQEQVWAMHLVDDALKDVAWDLNLGDGRV